MVHCDIPSLLLTNANRILNKLDELSLLLSSESIDIVAVTETGFLMKFQTPLFL